MKLCEKHKITEIEKIFALIEYFTFGDTSSKRGKLLVWRAPDPSSHTVQDMVLEHTTELEAHLLRFCCTIVYYFHTKDHRITPPEHRDIAHPFFDQFSFPPTAASIHLWGGKQNWSKNG